MQVWTREAPISDTNMRGQTQVGQTLLLKEFLCTDDKHTEEWKWKPYAQGLHTAWMPNALVCKAVFRNPVWQGFRGKLPRKTDITGITFARLKRYETLVSSKFIYCSLHRLMAIDLCFAGRCCLASQFTHRATCQQDPYEDNVREIWWTVIWFRLIFPSGSYP